MALVMAKLAGFPSPCKLSYREQPHFSTLLQQILVYEDTTKCPCIIQFLICIVLHKLDVMFMYLFTSKGRYQGILTNKFHIRSTKNIEFLLDY